MYPRKITSPFLVFVAAALILLLIIGCGSSGTVGFSDPIELFQHAKVQTETTDSFRMNGDMTIKISLGSNDYNIKYGIKSIFEKNGEDSWIVKMDMALDMGIPEGSTAPFGKLIMIKSYITDGKMYMKMPESNTWAYQAREEWQDLTNLSNGMSPQSLGKLLDAAKDTELLEEGPDTVKYRLVLDVDKLYTPEVAEKARQSAVRSGIPLDKIGAFVEGMKSMISGMDVTVTADKNSGLLVAMTMQIDNFMGSLGDSLLADDPLPGGSEMSIYADFTLSGYGKKYGIKLPEETYNAIPMEELKQTTR